MSKSDSKIIVALDFEKSTELEHFVEQLDPAFCRVKVGKTLFTKYGPAIIGKLNDRGFEVFLDLKFHDIPQQVAGACLSASELGVWMLNVHALGGLAMLKAAKVALEQVAQATGKRPLLIGVTVLTSLGEKDLAQFGITESVEKMVFRLASLCYEAGLDGVVCSALEATSLKKQFGPDFICVTPGIRLKGDDTQDQKRVMTPVDALQAGSDYLVMGRSITEARFPLKQLQEINEVIEAL